MSLRRHTLHHADPDYLQPPIYCPNPKCEGGLEYPVGQGRHTSSVPNDDGTADIYEFIGVGGTHCPICAGKVVIHDEQDIENAYRWAEARGLRVTEALDALHGEDD